MKHQRAGRVGFTVIELLVVIAIIATLIGLLLPALSHLREMAYVTKTTTRLLDVQRAVVGDLSADRNVVAAQRLHARLRATAPTGAVQGVVDFSHNPQHSIQSPQTGTWITTPYAPHYFAHPWGRIPTDLAETPPTRLPNPSEEALLQPETRHLSDLTPIFSAELCALAGILPADLPATAAREDLDAYRSDRSPDRPWNDAWGNPLVIGFGLYQPRQNTLIATAARSTGNNNFAQIVRGDLFLTRAQQAYGFTREIYIAPAAIGPQLPAEVSSADVASTTADWSGTDGVLVRLWRAINAICNEQNGEELWRVDATATPPVNAMQNPPWKGVRVGRRAGAPSLLHAPIGVR